MLHRQSSVSRPRSGPRRQQRRDPAEGPRGLWSACPRSQSEVWGLPQEGCGEGSPPTPSAYNHSGRGGRGQGENQSLSLACLLQNLSHTSVIKLIPQMPEQMFSAGPAIRPGVAGGWGSERGARDAGASPYRACPGQASGLSGSGAAKVCVQMLTDGTGDGASLNSPLRRHIPHPLRGPAERPAGLGLPTSSREWSGEEAQPPQAIGHSRVPAALPLAPSPGFRSWVMTVSPWRFEEGGSGGGRWSGAQRSERRRREREKVWVPAGLRQCWLPGLHVQCSLPKADCLPTCSGVGPGGRSLQPPQPSLG